MEFKYNEETGTEAIEEYIIQTIRGLPNVKADLNITIRYCPAEAIAATQYREDTLEDTPQTSLSTKDKDYSQLPIMLSANVIKEFLQCGINQAYKLIHSGELHVIRVGRSVKVPKHSFIAWLENKS